MGSVFENKLALKSGKGTISVLTGTADAAPNEVFL